MNDLAALVRWAELGRYKAIGEWSSGSGESGSGLEPMPMNNSEWIFFGLLTFCDFFVLLLLISSLGGFFRRLSDHRTTRARRQAGQSSLSDALAVQSMAIIVRSQMQARRGGKPRGTGNSACPQTPLMAPHSRWYGRCRAICRMSSTL
eukprot:scaffold102060_cov26-Tisochrysis_lutea.AAC.2